MLIFVLKAIPDENDVQKVENDDVVLRVDMMLRQLTLHDDDNDDDNDNNNNNDNDNDDQFGHNLASDDVGYPTASSSIAWRWIVSNILCHHQFFFFLLLLAANVVLFRLC
jgi:hypothetical protein